MPRPELELVAHAKVNLFLQVLGNRDDGYHDLELVFQTLSLNDRLVLQDRSDAMVRVRCSHPHVPGNQDNLVLQAVRLLHETTGVQRGVTIYLHKRIPVAAGFGGGSSDAAAVLRGLNRFWSLGLSPGELQQLARNLGADVAYFLTGGTCLGRGIGDLLTPLPDLPPLWVLLACPRVRLSTGEVFRLWDQEERQDRVHLEAFLASLRRGDLAAIGANMANVLEKVSGRLCPEIVRLRQYMLAQGALGSLMSGSGPAVFALVATAREAEIMADRVRGVFPKTWVQITRSCHPGGEAREDI